MSAWMRHPDLPQDQLIEVAENAVPHHRAAGWVVTDAPTAPEPQPKTSKHDTAPAEDAGADVPEPAPRRRQAAKEDSK
jgi:hypothetical protein